LNDYEKVVKHKAYTKKYNLQDKQYVFKYLDEVYADYFEGASKVQKQVFLNKLFKGCIA